MVEKYQCVIDAEGRYVTYVLILDGNIQYYSLKESESLIDAKPPVMRTSTARDGYLVPIWDIDASTWAEGATAGEITAWEALHPVLPQTEHPPTTEQRVSDLEEQLIQADETAIDLYEAQEKQEVINAQQDEALMELYEMKS